MTQTGTEAARTESPLQTEKVIQFFVPGIPRPGGSKKGFYNPKIGRVMMVKAGGQYEENWRQAVAHSAMQAMKDEPPFKGPVRLSCLFYMPRPKYHYHTSKKMSGKLRTEYHGACPHLSAPDRGKLLRSTEDAMKGIVYADDSQVYAGPVNKLYGERPGADIKITLHYIWNPKTVRVGHD
jgi:Holliday junction resolvase RusA-like endonuclease